MIRQHAQLGGGIMHFPPRVDDFTLTFLILGVGCSNFVGIYFRWRPPHFRCLFLYTPIHRPRNMGWATIADRFWKFWANLCKDTIGTPLVSLVNQTLIFSTNYTKLLAVVVSMLFKEHVKLRFRPFCGRFDEYAMSFSIVFLQNHYTGHIVNPRVGGPWL